MKLKSINTGCAAAKQDPSKGFYLTVTFDDDTTESILIPPGCDKTVLGEGFIHLGESLTAQKGDMFSTVLTVEIMRPVPCGTFLYNRRGCMNGYQAGVVDVIRGGQKPNCTAAQDLKKGPGLIDEKTGKVCNDDGKTFKEISA